MKVLITNGDGVGAAQLPNLIRSCQKFADVTTVVPTFEQSRKSHCIDIHKSFAAKEVELERGLTVLLWIPHLLTVFACHFGTGSEI